MAKRIPYRDTIKPAIESADRRDLDKIKAEELEATDLLCVVVTENMERGGVLVRYSIGIEEGEKEPKVKLTYKRLDGGGMESHTVVHDAMLVVWDHEDDELPTAV